MGRLLEKELSSGLRVLGDLAGARGPCVTGQHLRALRCGGPEKRSWWIGAPWWKGCTPVHSIHRQARIPHANPGHGAGNQAAAEAAGTDAASGTPGTAARSMNSGAISSAATTT